MALMFFFRCAGAKALPDRAEMVLRCITDWGFEDHSFVVKLKD
jgi:hypothetical protein